MIKTKELFVSGIAVSAAIAIGRVFGFFREILLASVFGQTYEADIATLSLTIPDIIVNIILGGAFSAALMSTFVKASDQENIDTILYLHYTIGGFFICITTLFFIYASDIGHMLAPSIPPVAQGEFVLLLKITCWSIPFIVCSCILTTSLNAKGIFFLPAMGNTVINLTICLSILYLLLIEKKILILVAVAIVIGSIFRWLFQIIPVIANVKSINICSWESKIDKVSVFSRYGKAFFATLSLLMIPIIARFYMIKTGAGQLANLNYSQKLMDLLITFIVGSLVSVLLPKLSGTKKNVRIVFFLSIIIFLCFIFGSIIYFYVAEFIATILFGYGAFDENAIGALTVHLKASALVLPFYSTVFFLTGSLSVTDLSNKSALACFAGLALFLILLALQIDTLTCKAIYQSMAYGYGAIFLLQISFIYFHERRNYAQSYVYNQ